MVAGGAWFVRQHGWTLGGSVASTGRHSIVVLPFANLSGDPEQAYLADGLTTKITTDLSRAAGLFVIAATTANTFRNKQANVQQVGKDLGVRYALQGNVQRSGEKIRINAQLADTSSGGQLWAETFDGDRSDLFALQDQITSRIANSIGREIVVAAARESEARKTDPQASDLLLRAVALTTKTRTLENLQQQEKLFREILVLDPNSVDAMAQLATCLLNQRRVFINVLGPQVAEEKLKEGYSIALKANELDPANALTYEALGMYFTFRRDLAQAIAAFQKGIALNRNHMHFYDGLARASLISGEPKKAIEYAEQAQSLDPRGPQITTSMIFLGVGHFFLGHDDLAIEWLERRARRIEEPQRAFPPCRRLRQERRPGESKGDYGGTVSHRAQLQALEWRFLSIPIIARGLQKTVARGLHASGKQGGSAGVSLVAHREAKSIGNKKGQKNQRVKGGCSNESTQT